MGAIHQAPLAELVATLQQQYQLRNFVETGTFKGAATAWAASRFAHVWTIEIRADFQAEAKQLTGEPPNVSFLLGNSAQRLAEVCTELKTPALFWLDAHSGAGRFGPDENCPLLEEIDIITRGDLQHILLIDDARAIYAPPPPPFDYLKWPSLEEVLHHLQAYHHYHVVLLVDCLICVPNSARDLLAKFSSSVRPKI